MTGKILEPDTKLTEGERVMVLTELLKPCPCCGGKSEIFASHFQIFTEVEKCRDSEEVVTKF